VNLHLVLLQYDINDSLVIVYTISITSAINSIRNDIDIMDIEEQEDQKIRMSARDTLNKVSGKGKVRTLMCRV